MLCKQKMWWWLQEPIVWNRGFQVESKCIAQCAHAGSLSHRYASDSFKRPVAADWTDLWRSKPLALGQMFILEHHFGVPHIGNVLTGFMNVNRNIPHIPILKPQMRKLLQKLFELDAAAWIEGLLTHWRPLQKAWGPDALMLDRLAGTLLQIYITICWTNKIKAKVLR